MLIGQMTDSVLFIFTFISMWSFIVFMYCSTQINFRHGFREKMGGPLGGEEGGGDQSVSVTFGSCQY